MAARKKKVTKKKKVAKKATTTRKKTIKKAPTKKRSSRPASTADVATDLATALGNSQEMSGSSGMNFVKFEEGENDYQFVIDPTGLMNMKGVFHNGTSPEGKFSQVADLNFVTNSPALQQAALDAGKLTEEDLDLIAKYGDPAEKLYNALEASGMKREDIRKPKVNPCAAVRIAWNCTKDGEHGLLETSNGFGKWFMKTAKKFPDLLSRVISVDGEGKGIRRRYEYYVGDNEGPADVESPYKLVPHFLRRIVGYKEKAEFVVRSYGPQLVEAGLGRKDFGI